MLHVGYILWFLFSLLNIGFMIQFQSFCVWQKLSVLLPHSFDISEHHHKDSLSCEWLLSASANITTLSVQFSHSVMSNSLWPHGLQHARLPCPSTTPGACSNLCPLSRWCHPTIPSSVIPFSCLESFPPSRSFPMSQFYASGGQNIGVSASASVLPMNIQDWFPLGLTGLLSLQSKGLWKCFLQHHSSKGSTLWCCFLYGPTLTSMHDYWKNHSFD